MSHWHSLDTLWDSVASYVCVSVSRDSEWSSDSSSVRGSEQRVKSSPEQTPTLLFSPGAPTHLGGQEPLRFSGGHDHAWAIVAAMTCGCPQC